MPAPRAMSTPMPMVLACPLAPFMAAFMRLARDVCVDGYHGTSLCFADTLYTLFWPGQHIFCVHLSILPRFDEVWNLVLGWCIEMVGNLHKRLFFCAFCGLVEDVYYERWVGLMWGDVLLAGVVSLHLRGWEILGGIDFVVVMVW
jgi:hypothetical protein